MKKRFSFTMVELLAVCSLVAVLGAIGFAGYGYAMTASKKSATEALLKQIEVGLENVRQKQGIYPATGGSYLKLVMEKDSDSLIIGLSLQDDSNSKKLEWKSSSAIAAEKKALESFLKAVDQEKIKKASLGSASGPISDSWGGTVYYCYPGQVNTKGYDLIAPGEDGKFGVAAANVPAASPDASTYKDGDDWACDDIANFSDK